MTPPLLNILEENWQTSFNKTLQESALDCLEQGQVIYFPQLTFYLNEQETHLLQPQLTHSNAKNISFDALQNRLQGISKVSAADKNTVIQLLARYHAYAQSLITHLVPDYESHLTSGRTSLRTLEAQGRRTSPKKDDNRLHIDAFPSLPMGNRRILRVFSNINPDDKPRIWYLGESFAQVAQRFLPLIKPPLPGSRWLLHYLHITKRYRTAYDHYMLGIHDHMKLDEYYQQQVPKFEIQFPAGSTWIVFTDVTSHAAISGQYLLEQTFYLPYTAMRQPTLSPQAILKQQQPLALT